MTATLTAAHTAFQLSASALQQLGEAPVEQPKKTHSLWSSWPVVAAGFSCLITTVNTVAMAVLGNMPLAVLLSLSAISTGILTINLWSFSTLNDLAEYVESFAERVTMLSHTALNLSKTNKDINATRIALEDEIKKSDKKFKEKKQQVINLLHRIDQVTSDLQGSQQQIAEMGKILDGSHDVITEMTSKIEEFVSLNKELSTSSQLLAEELTSIQKLSTRIDSTTSTLESHNSSLLAKKQQAEEMARGLHTQFMQIAELLVGLKKEREALEKGMNNLQNVDTSLAAHTSELQAVAENLNRGASETQAFIDSLKQYDGIAQTLKEQMRHASEEDKDE